MRRKKRKTLAKGVYEDASGRMIRISVKGEPVEFRKDKHGQSYKDRDTSWLIQERIRRQADATQLEDIKAETRSLFPADVDRFLETIASPRHKLNTQGYMKHWSAVFEDTTRNAITDLDAQAAFAQMEQADSTKIHLRRALIQFYETLNGKSGYNPGRSLKKPPKPDEPVRDLPWEWIERMFKVLPESRTKARLLLIAYVGLPQKQIALLKPSDLRLERRELVVHPRRKGAGAAGRTIPLSDAAIAALKTFQRLEAFGTFQNRQMVETFHSGFEKAGITLPAGARPYDLRHSFLTEVARGGADIRDIATLGMHATLEQSARYIKGAVSARATNMIQSIPRFLTTTKPGKTTKRSRSLHQKRGPKPTRSKDSRRKKSRKS